MNFNQMANSLWFWRIMFIIMFIIATAIYLARPRTILKRETIYIILDPTSDEPPRETRFI